MISHEAWFQESRPKVSDRALVLNALERSLRTDPYDAETMARVFILRHRYGILKPWLSKHLFSGIYDPWFNDFPYLWEFIKDSSPVVLPKEVWVDVYELFRQQPRGGYLNYAWEVWFTHGLKEILGGYYPNFSLKEINSAPFNPTGIVTISTTIDGEERPRKAAYISSVIRSLHRGGWNYDPTRGTFENAGSGGSMSMTLEPEEGVPQIVQWVEEAKDS